MSKHLLEDNPRLIENYNKKQGTFPKNLILYGPPGTGKTYHSLNYAVAIIEGKTLEETLSESRTILQQRFQKYLEDGQVATVSFHQSYTYEDFIQGIKPNTQASTLMFQQKDGIFKQMADRSKANYDSYTKRQNPPKIPFEEILNLLLSKALDPDTEEIEIKLDTAHRIYKSIIIFDLDENALIYKRKTKNNIIKDEKRQLSIQKLKNFYEKKEVKEAINLKYYQAVLEAMRQYETNFKQRKEVLELKNYVLIIDEMNRANVNNVFGELITLLEENKRYGEPQALSASLPQGERFYVPKNLYLIGTMNTADQSISMLDLALRRRFRFKAMYPEEDLIKDKFTRNMLKKLNQTILKYKQSPDLLLGHSFFLDKTKADLSQIFQEQIFPLLEIYFLNNRQKVKQVLQEAQIPFIEKNYQLYLDLEVE